MDRSGFLSLRPGEALLLENTPATDRGRFRMRVVPTGVSNAIVCEVRVLEILEKGEDWNIRVGEVLAVAYAELEREHQEPFFLEEGEEDERA